MNNRYIVALAGNPNVGKSTLFNRLTGLRQHTGNWPGKTVSTARGEYRYRDDVYELVDLPGTYSLSARSAEEEVARDAIRSGEADVVAVVLDGTNLERNLPLALAVLGAARRAIVCVNLLDEAGKQGIKIDMPALEAELGAPVVPLSARSGRGVRMFQECVREACLRAPDAPGRARETGAEALFREAERICERCVSPGCMDPSEKRLKIDKLLTGKWTGIPIMLVMLILLFYITITLSNIPSEHLSRFLLGLEDDLYALLMRLRAPVLLARFLTEGMYRVTAFVVSAMLPPMAIFFPLFTLMEDLGYLPRIAFNMDAPLKRCGACGKQCLTMCMGLGCNVVGVMGARIIDSPRERMIAILTNAMTPCNGRFPLLIVVMTMFFFRGGASPFLPALCLTAVMVVSVLVTLLTSKLLSATVLKGLPSSFALELSPLRRPQILKTVVRSIVDRTGAVLLRAIAVAAPAGGLIFLLSNVSPGGTPLISSVAGALTPLARAVGLDGVILTAFILGFPANEIVLPIAIMTYLSGNGLAPLSETAALYGVLALNGWTVVTAVCVMLFSMFHWPCSTTVLTIYRETKSLKWTALATALPAAVGLILCACVNAAAKGIMLLI